MIKKKLLSLILALCMVMSLLPTIAFANGSATPVQIEVKNAQNGKTQYKIGDGEWVDLNTSMVWDIPGISDGDTVTVHAIPNPGQELDGAEFWVNGYQENQDLDTNALVTEAGWSFTYTEGNNYKVIISYRNPGQPIDPDNPPPATVGELCFTCQGGMITGGSIYYKLNNTDDFTKVGEENNQYNSISITEATSIAIKFAINEGYKLDTTRGVTLRVNGMDEFRSTNDNIADFTSESGYTFDLSDLVGDGSVSESRFELEFGFETMDDNPGDPQPGHPFTAGIRINNRGVPLTVEGAESSQNDGNYTFNEGTTGAMVTFNDTEDRVKGLSVRVFDSNGPVSNNRLQQKSYTINDVTMFYEIEVIDYNAIFDNQYRADYDNSGDKTVKVGNVILDRDHTQTFEKDQTITFIASAEPYKVIVRPNDDRDVELPITGTSFSYTPDTDMGFELKVYWSEGEYNYDNFQGTETLPIVVEYTKDSDTALTLSGAEIADADIITYGNNTKVRLANDVESLTFDWGQNTPKRICAEGEDVDPQDTSYTLDLTQDTKTFYRLEFRWNDDPEPDWRTVSWDGGNVTVENGTVTAERIYLGDKTFTIHPEESSKSETDKIYPIEGLGEYGLGFGDTDLFIGNDVTEDVSIDFKFKPAYGYQLSDILTNETDSLLSGFTASASELSTFNFKVRPDSGNIHFNVMFAPTEDIIQNSSNSVDSVTIANGANAADSGNLKLTVADLDENMVSEDLKARAGESALYLDMNLYQVVNKVTEEGNWENQLQDLNGTITVTLEVPAPAEGSSYYLIREHGDGEDRTYSRIEVTFVPDANDPTKGTITFETDKFSNYALAQAAEPVSQTADFTASDNGIAALALLNSAKTGREDSTWDSAAKILTLKGVNFTTTATTAVKLPADATIVLTEGTESIIASVNESAGEYCSHGIYTEGDLTVEGDGALTATGGMSHGRYTHSCGIYALESNITVSGGAVNAIGGTADRDSFGIFAGKNIIIKSGIVKASGSASTGYNGESSGIYVSQDVTIEGGRVEVAGGDAVISQGIEAGNVFISGEATDVTATGSKADSLSYGIYANCDLAINRGNVKVAGSEATGESGGSYGIYAWEDVTIKDSRVETTGGKAVYSYGICSDRAGDLTIEDCTVEATGSEAVDRSFGIYICDNITINSGTVTAAGGKASEYSDGIYAGINVTINAGTVIAEAGEAGIESFGIEAYRGTINISGGHVIARTLDESGTHSALNKAPTLPAAYSWRIVAEDAFTAYPTKAYTYSETQTYVEIMNTQTPQPPFNPFIDVESNEYYYDAVLWAVENEITNGTSDTIFSPYMPCTRAQTVTFLWRAAGCPTPQSSEMPFTDVVRGSYYETAVLWAVENGITEGTSDTTFSPDIICDRAQFVTLLWRSQDKPAAGTDNYFTDVVRGSYYETAVLWAVENGITNGTSNTTFSPDYVCTRSQVVTFLYRCLGE